MKIVNVEDGKKKVYVQLNDIMMMMQLDSLIPAEVMEKVFSDIFIVTDENRFEFKEFGEESTIEFFEACDWIPDFRKYKNMTEEEIIADGQSIAAEMNAVAQEWNNMTEEERENHQDLPTRHERLGFKMKSTAEILWTKQGYRVMPFPIVPDYQGFKFAEQNDCPYVAQQGLNPLQVLIFRVDGKKLDPKKEIIPQGLVQGTESVLINDNLEHNEFFGESFERTRELSEDDRYFVTTFKIVPPQLEEKQDISKNQNNGAVPERPKSLGKRIKNWIDRTFR